MHRVARLSSWDYLDFELEIREGGSRGYEVAAHSPAGEAQEEMSFPFDERQLRDKLKDLEIALLRSGGTGSGLSTEEQTVQEFGRSLFEAVFVGKVGTCYYRSMDQAQQEGKGLRLKLHVKPPNLTVLPWEFLYDPHRDEYLGFSRDTPIVRYTDLRLPVGRLSVEPPLRILGMISSPRDLAPLDVEHEKSLMEEAIEDLQADGLVKLTWLEGETWRDLQRAMRRDGPWHIFHFVGHGDFDPSAQEGLIAFAEEGTGRSQLLRSRDLARLMDGHPSLRLMFLNSCEGARGSEGDPFSGTASTLVRRGIPAVVAMQYQITDKAAIEFCSAFYESLADGLPVDAAVTEARVAVSMDSVLEWGTPVLYMRSPDGRLFDISTDKRPSEQPLGITDQEELHKHQEQTAREKERKERLDTLYAQARRSHQNQEWHAVVDVFEQISEVDQDYSDPEGLLQSALEALMRERKERDALRRYREAVKSAWADGELDSREVERLRDLANELGLHSSAAANIANIEREMLFEREVLGGTTEDNQIASRRVYRFRDSTLSIVFANITSSDAQVIVSSDDSFLTMSGGVSAAIRHAGGNAIALDAAKKIPVALGDVAVTTAGTLRAHYVFHAVTIGVGEERTRSREIIEISTRRCMQLVNALRADSIAFPAIGAGTAGFSYEEVAAKMAEVIADELSRFERPVDVAIYLHDPYRPDRVDTFAFAEEFVQRESQWREASPSTTRDEGRSSGSDVFVSYSHKDKIWLERLQEMLEPLLRKGSISVWDDTKIAAGEEWRKEIEDALASAKAAVLLVSPAFLASEFIAEEELPPLLARAEEQGLKILWVYLSHCLYDEAGIGVYQAAHDISRPLASLRRAKYNEQLLKVCQEIKKVAVSV